MTAAVSSPDSLERPHPEFFLIAGERRPAAWSCDVHACGFAERDGRFGRYFVCEEFGCDRVLTFSKSDGRWRISDRATRQGRIHCHDLFDRLWKRRVLGRRAAYRWLALQCGIPGKDCHFQHMSILGLRWAYRLIRERCRSEGLL